MLHAGWWSWVAKVVLKMREGMGWQGGCKGADIRIVGMCPKSSESLKTSREGFPLKSYFRKIIEEKEQRKGEMRRKIKRCYHGETALKKLLWCQGKSVSWLPGSQGRRLKGVGNKRWKMWLRSFEVRKKKHSPPIIQLGRWSVHDKNWIQGIWGVHSIGREVAIHSQ